MPNQSTIIGETPSIASSGFSANQLAQIRDQLLKTAGQPKSVTVDGETYTSQSLSELLAAYRLALASVPKANGGLTFRKFVPPGAS